MEAIIDFFSQGGIAQSIIILATTIFAGLLLGEIKIGGISLGVTWILFVGLFIGFFDCFSIDGEVLHFIKEFGLILFVYAIGSQVGASFFSSLRNGGLKMNLLAVGLICFNVMAALAIHFLTNTDISSVVGLMSGAVTNTPGLGAAQQTFTDITGESASFLAAGYAIAYPMGVIGVIIIFILVRKLCKDKSDSQETEVENQLDIFSLEVQNAQCFGKSLQEIEKAIKADFVITRLYHTYSQTMEIPNKRSVFQEGDRIYVIATKDDAKTVELSIGNRIDMDLGSWDQLDTELICRSVVVSNSNINGKSLSSFDIRNTFGVNISRIVRAGINLIPTKHLTLQLGDKLVVVGGEKSIKKLELFFGNSQKKLCDPHMIPIFLGIALGVILGSIPFKIPGIPQPVKLGLAGGPLIVAILINRFGTSLHLVTYATRSAMKMLQEVGISLFLAAVGLSSGKIFFETLLSHGATWFLYGSTITIVPVAIAAFIGRIVLKLEVPQLLGLISGACTNPAALAFANSTDETGKTSSSYATVYPLSMLMRIMAAQFLILLNF